MNDDPRASLASIAASLRAYLEWQEDTGASGIPRVPRAPLPAREPVNPPSASLPAPVRVPESDHVAAPAPAPARAPASLPVPVPVPGSDHVAPPVPAPVPVPAPAPAHSPVVTAAPRAPRLAQLKDDVAACRKCGLAETRTQTVFARGNPEAKLCFIGEAPGADEDATGIPFVGRAGQLLDKMIGAMGLSPERDVYVCNIIKCRPPGNRKPTPEETDACIPHLHEQLAVVQPRVIVALGNTAVATLLGTTLGISKIRGQWKLYRQMLVMPTYHPSYLLRPSPQQSEAKREAWEDLQSVMKELGLPLPKRGG
jgi:DNA polymerase